jgi:hypothetical protein
MRPEGRPGELFAAFSRINARAFRDDRLVSCPVLSKAPDNGDVLRHFLAPGPRRPRGPFFPFTTALRYLAANTGHLLFMLCTALFLRFLRFPMPEALRTGAGKRFPGKAPPPSPSGGGRGSADEEGNGDGELLILDSFAVLPALAGDGVHHELYLPGLEDAARAAGRETLTLFRLYGGRDPRLLWKALGVLSRKRGAFTEVHLLTCADWGRLLLHILLYPVSLARLVRSLQSREAKTGSGACSPSGQAADTGVDGPGCPRPSPLPSPEACIREALIDCAGRCVLVGESRRLAARRLAFLLSSAVPAGTEGDSRLLRERSGRGPDASSAGTRPARIVSWYENQTVNKAFQRGLAQAEKEGARHVPVTGAQLFIWPDNLLNNHADDVEKELGLVPDRVLVNGPYFLPEHSRQQYAVGPALRYGDVFRAGGRPADACGGRRALRDSPAPALILLSYHPEETRRVLRLLLPAGTENPEAFAYRFHPATRAGEYAVFLPPGARLSTGPLREALDEAGAVIGAGSGALVEAAAAGIPVLSVDDPSGIPGLGLNYLPLCGKGELWESVRFPDDIAPALAGLRARLSDPDRPAKVRAFRDMLFCEATPERIRESFML